MTSQSGEKERKKAQFTLTDAFAHLLSHGNTCIHVNMENDRMVEANCALVLALVINHRHMAHMQYT